MTDLNARLPATAVLSRPRRWLSFGLFLVLLTSGMAYLLTRTPSLERAPPAPGVATVEAPPATALAAAASAALKPLDSAVEVIVRRNDTLDGIFRDAPVPVVTHCEDTPTIEANLAKERARYGDAIPIERHPYIRSREACIKSTRLAIELARRHGTRLHVLHISTADELALFAPGPSAGKRITAETCVHFLHFSEVDYATKGNLIKCNPAIKSESDRQAIIAALRDGRIDILATDHAPHTLEEKQQSYEKAPSGLPLVQFVLQCALERWFDGQLPLELIVEKTAHAPAQLFNVRDRGFIREGYWADLTLIDPAAPHKVTREGIISKCGWSPFEGTTFRSSIVATWVNGHLAWRDGMLDDSQLGRRLEFDR